MVADIRKETQKLRARIEHLEEHRRFIHSALEMVLSLSDFHKHLSKESDHHLLLQEALQRFENILPLQGCAILLVDDRTAEFVMTLCVPEAQKDLISSHVEFMIEEGFFAWAVRERRGVIIASHDHANQFLVHVIANHSRVQGMFVGLLQPGKVTVPDTSLSLLSITLLNLANVMESMQLYQWVKNQNAILEKKVAERTHKLDLSSQKLKRAMVNLEKMAHQADQANKAKSQFLANMSHEIRTPLNGIIGCAELMLRSDDLENCRSLARLSLGESEHLLNLINNVLDYSKIEAGKIELEQNAFNLMQLLNDLTAGMQIQAQDKGLVLDLCISGEPAKAFIGDALRLRQVLANLLNNAIKFTPQGSVTLSVDFIQGPEHNCQSINFAVMDTGIGIPPERQQVIFNRFTQADQSTTRRYGGTGLGTTIANQLVTIMGGRLKVQSYPDRGTTFSFTISLPIDSTPAGVQSSRRDLAHVLHKPPRRADILLAEDTAVNQLVLRLHLEACGHKVYIADNGLLAIEACRSQQFDLVLMDIQMPEMDGIAATRWIRSHLPSGQQMPILALTANADVQTRSKCQAAGMDDILTKPIRRETLLAAVQEALNETNARRSNGDCLISPPSASGVDLAVQVNARRPLDLDMATYEFGDREMVRQVVDQLILSGTEQLEDIRQAIQHNEIDTIRKLSHALKGGAATAEAKPLAEAAAELENQCNARDLARIHPAFDQLSDIFAEFKSYVKTIEW